MSTRFVTGKDLWPEVTTRVQSARRVRAAVAYFGEAGHRLLPLREGDTLVVDLSLAAVKAGVTNPFSVEHLVRRKVLVYSRPNLHAKVIVADRTAVIGSANASARSASVLEEAAIITDDVAAVRSAIGFVDSICLEPVRPEYLRLCKKHYRPPRLLGPGRGAVVREAPKLWTVLLNSDYEVPTAERGRYRASEEAARERIRDKRTSSLDSFHWPSKPAMADSLRAGHWVLPAVKAKDGSVEVGPPEQFLWLDRYARGNGKSRYVFHLELPRGGESVSWARFRRALPASLKDKYERARTRGIFDGAEADALMSLWTLSGRFRA